MGPGPSRKALAMFVPERNTVVGTTIVDVRLYPSPDTLVDVYGVNPMEGFMASLSDAALAQETGDLRSTPAMDALLSRHNVPATVVPAGTTFQVIEKCDGEMCTCGSLAVRFDDSPLGNEIAVIVPGEYGPLTDVATIEAPTDEEIEAFFRALDENAYLLDDGDGYWSDGTPLPDEPEDDGE